MLDLKVGVSISVIIFFPPLDFKPSESRDLSVSFNIVVLVPGCMLVT